MRCDWEYLEMSTKLAVLAGALAIGTYFLYRSSRRHERVDNTKDVKHSMQRTVDETADSAKDAIDSTREGIRDLSTPSGDNPRRKWDGVSDKAADMETIARQTSDDIKRSAGKMKATMERKDD